MTFPDGHLARHPTWSGISEAGDPQHVSPASPRPDDMAHRPPDAGPIRLRPTAQSRGLTPHDCRMGHHAFDATGHRPPERPKFIPPN